MFTTFTASMLALLHRYTGQSDLVVGTVSANRSRNVLAPVIGFLVNTLPIRTDLSGDPSFTELLARVKESVLGAFAHQDLPFSMIVDTLKVPRDASRTPVFQIMLTYGEREDAAVPAADVEFRANDLVAGIDVAKFDLAFAAQACSDGLLIECSYKTSLFEPATIERLLAHLETLLHGVVAKPASRLSELPVLTEAESHAELIDWNDTAGPAPDGCAHQRFEAQAAATPDALAAQYEDEQVTYAELNRQANQIAHRLRELGVGPPRPEAQASSAPWPEAQASSAPWPEAQANPAEPLVGVCMRTSLRRLAAFIGIWKAGGGYVPLDPDLPRERLEFMVTDTGMKIIVADKDAVIPALPAETIMVNDHLEEVGNLTDVGVTPADAAYVIYTSGSTGQPKGVLVEHRNLVNLASAMSARWQVGPGSRVLQFASFTFDVSVMDMFMPLLSGGTLVLAAPDTLHSPPRLAALLRDARITFTGLPPAVLNLLPEGDYPDLRTIMAAGEELPTELARRWIRPGLQLVNGYGPTEATVIATQAEITARTPMPPPIGFPVHPNYHAYVLDAHLNPVPVGVTGELHLGGAGLARGYLNRPELTAERFVRAPSGERLYKTGDLVKRRSDGSIVYLGRIDSQVKIHGVRIELGEIEAALLTHHAVAQAVVRVIDGELAAYVRPSGPVDEANVREHLARILPGAMIPAHFIALDTFPLNSSGKVDKKSLPQPSRDRVTGHVEPATPTESILVGLYATLLKADRVGATEGFFDLGGNSLTAMRLVDMISRETGADIGVTSVFLHPTPRRLGEYIDTLRDGDAGPVLLLTAAAGGPGQFSTAAGAPPLFLVHAIGGTVAAYTTLSQELAGTFTVYGIESPGLHGDIAPTLPDLVTDYVRRIRTVQHSGPYHLAGWSMGGLIAFEIARHLEQAGAEVGSLVLLDAPFAIGEDWDAGAAELAGRFVADAACTMGLEVASAPDAATATLDEQLGWLAAQLSAGDDPAITRQLRRRFDVFSAHSRMIAGYQPAAPRPEAQASSALRPEAQASSALRPEAQASSALRPEAQASSAPRPEAQASPTLRPEAQANSAPRVRAPALIVSALGSLNAPARERWPSLLSGPVRIECVDSDHYAFLRPPLVARIGAVLREWGGQADGR